MKVQRLEKSRLQVVEFSDASYENKFDHTDQLDNVIFDADQQKDCY